MNDVHEDLTPNSTLKLPTPPLHAHRLTPHRLITHHPTPHRPRPLPPLNPPPPHPIPHAPTRKSHQNLKKLCNNNWEDKFLA